MAGSGARRTVTMTDVARLAGVSVTTVSHVVNRTRPVAPETEHAVLAAIATVGYLPDNVVRSQRTAGPRTIGLAMSMMSDPYQGDLVHNLLAAADATGYNLLLSETHETELGELRAVTELVDHRVAAIILAPSAHPEHAIGYADRNQIPVVLIDRTTDADVDQVTIESFEATATLVDHLVTRHGHRRIGFVSGTPGLTTTKERLAGYREGLRRNGIRQSRGYVAPGLGEEDRAEEATAALLALPRPPTAILAANNRMMVGTMRAVTRAGLEVPRDLAVVGFDDFSWADTFRPRLTVLRQPHAEIGRRVLSLVADRIARRADPPRRVVLEPTFVQRESCGCTYQT